MDNTTGLPAIDATQFVTLKPLFDVGSARLDFTPNAQIQPRSFNIAIRGNTSAIYLVVVQSNHPGLMNMSSCVSPHFLILSESSFFRERFYNLWNKKHKTSWLRQTESSTALQHILFI